ncbi:SDR family NAD(P)-dependent oxidoreductase [Leifsonia sp. A12D58]|uniref:SDR family NAD(P)-dependent oxidoreductase n=1 Tax=Leifsonia sp. A12D58 TaxID=3397674 RepID=UPI0039E05329
MATDLQGKTIIITGSSSGLGREAALALADRGADVAVVGRNPERTKDVAEKVGGTPFLADFASFDQVRSLADALLARYETIDVLANNAGGLVSTRQLTEDGHELTIQSNHLSPFLLTSLLMPRLLETASAGRGVRVLSTASSANMLGDLRLDDLDWTTRRWNGGWRPYGSAKVATILYMRELARRTAGTGIDAYSFHPGFVNTSFGSDSPVMKFASKVHYAGLSLTPKAGAEPLIKLASARKVPAASGAYFDRLRPNGRTIKQAKDDKLAAGLWALSAEITGVDPLPKADSPTV